MSEVSAPGQTVIGFIGLGLMGRPMALNLLKAGFSLVAYNRSRPSMEAVAAAGATLAQSPLEVAQKSDIVVTNLPDAPDVEAVLFGENGAAAGMRRGMLFLDHSTIAPHAARAIATRLWTERGVRALDCPVSGGDIGAAAATLSVMIGCDDPAAVEYAMPVFRAVGKRISRVGNSGSGQVCKSANQIIVASQMVALSEAMAFAKANGTDPALVCDAIQGGAARCYALETKPCKLLSGGDRGPGFKARMQLKDLRIVKESAEVAKIPMPTTAVITELFEDMIAAGDGDLDHSAVVTVLERRGCFEL